MNDLRFTGSETHAPLTQAQADAYLANAHFKVCYNAYDLNWMLNYKSNTPAEVTKENHGSTAGIRLYEGVLSGGEGTILGAGVHESTFDVRGKHPYLRSNGNNTDEYATRLTLQNAIDNYLKYKQDSKLKYRVYASRATLNNILAKDGVLGIRFYNIDFKIAGKDVKTFMLVGVYKNAAGDLVDRKGDNEYVLLDRPCPPFCSHNNDKGLISMKSGIDY